MATKHNPDDADDSTVAIHHTLGINRHQAMPGDILTSVTLTGSRPADPLLRQIVNALVVLGAKDSLL